MFSVQAIFFDLGDTLVRIKLRILQQICKRLEEIRGQPLEINEYMDAFLKEWGYRSKPLDKQVIKSVNTYEGEIHYWKGFFESLLPTLGVSSAEPGLVEWLATMYSSSQSFECFEDVHTILAELKLHGCKLGLISNAFPSADHIMKDLGLSPYFDYVLLSFEHDFIKPEPAIYQFAVDQLMVDVKKAIFVDDRAKFVNAAIEFGMNAYLIERFPNPKERIVTKSLAPKIRNLYDLRNNLLGYEGKDPADRPFRTSGFSGLTSSGIEVQVSAIA
jgi:putative hydrolase of the HAD superfamily